MKLTETGRGVRHIAYRNVPATKRGVMLPNVQVVIPAKNVEDTIAGTVAYLIDLGLRPDQIHVIVNGCTDRTLERTLDCPCNVHDQEDIFTEHASAIAKVRETYKVSDERLHGKGTAMFASLFVLEALGLQDNTPIVFLDADITNIRDVDPVGLLLHGYGLGGSSLVKLASQGRSNEGIHAFLGLPGNPYMELGAVMWPLCGQVAVPWGLLRDMRLSTHYSIEMCMMMQVWERMQTMSQVCEVEIGTPLTDKRNDDRTHVLMYQKIVAFMEPFLKPGRSLSDIDPGLVAHINTERSHTTFWVPASAGGGPNKLERHRLDAILPSLAELMA